MASPWWKTGIIYQIYPRSFADSNGDGIGDLNGITARLDYLADLGVDAIWLSPIYPSPDVDFGYDVSDYCGVDPKFGTLADFDRLMAEAHKRNIRIILDLVLNHTSNQHPWFCESRSSRDNSKRDWYLWHDPGPGGRAPNNWQSVVDGPGWEFDPATGQYYFHSFFKTQPDVNWHNPAVRQAMLDVFHFWLERGVDGFRLDLFNCYFKHPQFKDNPSIAGLPIPNYFAQHHINDCDRPELIPLAQEIRALLDGYSTPGCERYVVGEILFSNAQKAARFCGPDRLQAAFNNELLESPWSASKFMNAIQRWEHALGLDAWPNYFLNNHDAIRSATRYLSLISGSHMSAIRIGNPENDARLKVAAGMLLTLRGTPFLYYGEEIGMRDIPIHSRKDVLDPVGKSFFPIIKGRDGCRSPMQWNATPGAGFTQASARSWLPVHADAAARNVATQCADPKSLFNFYRSLIAVRRASPALQEGMFQPLTFGTRYLMAYLRQTEDQTVLVAFNFSSRRKRLVLGSHLARAKYRFLLSSHRSDAPVLRSGLLALEPYEVLLLEVLPAG